MAQEDKRAQEAKVPGPDLRLVDRRAFVGFPPLSLAPGLLLSDFALQIPDVTFPFNITGGASRYQRKKLAFGYLELSVDAELITRRVQQLAGRLGDLEELKLHFRPGYLEGQARLRTAERAALTFKVAFDGDADRLAVYLYDVRFYAFCATPAAQVPLLLSQAVAELALLPGVELRGASGFSARVLPALVQLAAVSRGYKMPDLDQARLSAAEVSGKGLRLRFTSGGLPPPSQPDEELLLALEGARAFADAEELLAAGKLAEARRAYLRLGDAAEAHPFAAERLLTLMVADPQAHELALDLAASLAQRRDRSAAALWAEAVVRERRGESARAAERYLALCGLARRQNEEAGAFFAAESAARAARDHAPQMAVKALHELLGLKPDHLPSLKALARASDQARDRAGAIRAYRRLAALARDPADAADAHVHLAQLCAQTEDDLAGARLHCEAALRLAPDHPDALYQLGELCHRGGEHLRAIKALDRLREVSLGRHEVDRIGKANLLAGQVWEAGLRQPENALLRYREAISLLPGEPEPLFRAARVAEKLDKLPEALAGYQQAIELAGPAPRSDEARRAAHQAHHALARLQQARLSDPARAREHLEAALALDPRDLVAIDQLVPYFRASGRAPELADACEKAAAVSEDPTLRARYLAEAGELYRGRLNRPERAERLLSDALEADGRNRVALEGMLALAEGRRDGPQLCRCLQTLAELAPDLKERARYHRRLAVAARDLTFDLDLAAHALLEVLKAEPDDLPSLGELCALQRKRADMGGLAFALEARARAAEGAGDGRLAAAALRELAQVLEARLGRLGEALVALEKAARLSPEPQVLLDLANLALRCERPQHARRALEDLLAQLPRHAAPEKVAEIRARLGKACDLLGDKEAAREQYALAFPLRKLDDELATRLEALDEEAGRLAELTDLWAARAQALLAAGRATDAAPLFLKSAQALRQAGDAGGAAVRLQAALDAAPEGELAATVLEAIADLELARGDKLEAAKHLARRAQLAGPGRASSRLFFRAAQLAQGSAREEGFLGQALTADPTFAPARLRRAELRLEVDPRTALEDLESALATLSAEPDALEASEPADLSRRAGVAALRAGLLDSARAHLSSYVAQRPDDLGMVRELAALQRKAGAREPLFELLGALWPHAAGAELAALRREYAELALELSRVAPAVDALRQMVAAEPDNLWAARRLLGLLAEEARDERQALLTRLIDAAEGEERADLLTRRARLLREKGEAAPARADLLAASEVAARPAPLLEELAAWAREAGDDTGELAAWRRAVTLDASLERVAGHRLLALAQRRLAAQDAALAEDGFASAARLPLPPEARCEAYFGLAEARRLRGDVEGAENALFAAAAEGPLDRRVTALLGRAHSLEGRGQAGKAAASYEAALALLPGLAAAIDGLRRTLSAQEEFGRLAELLAGEVARGGADRGPELHAELASLYLERLGNPAAAETALRRAVQLSPQEPGLRRWLISLLAQRGQLAEAVPLLEQTVPLLSPEEGAALLREGVALCLAATQPAAALRLARRAHALRPAEGDDLAVLAGLLAREGEGVEALPLQQQLVAQARFDEAPERAEATFLQLADLAERAGDEALAEATLRRLLVARPTCGPAVERLAALLDARSPREAIELLTGYVLSLPPSESAAASLASLAGRARVELLDGELSARLWQRACELTEDPLPWRQRLVALYREEGRTPELLAELQRVSELCRRADDVGGAVLALDELAQRSEASGRIDEALGALRSMVDLCVPEGQAELAAGYERRRAELLRDAKLDLDAAAASLEKSFALSPELATAHLGVSLAQHRRDSGQQLLWLERSLPLLAPPQRAQAFVALARLHLGAAKVEGQRAFDGPLLAPELAEAALRQALSLAPEREEAQGLLAALLQVQERPADLAAYLEESAQRLSDPAARAGRLIEAARLYAGPAGRPQDAAAALLAARAETPDDWTLTAEAADVLTSLGRSDDALELDALLLEQDPFRPQFARHAAALERAGDYLALAALMLRRAQREEGPAAAASYLAAARAFTAAGALERAQVCEEQAFEKDPANEGAFRALSGRRATDPRARARLLFERAAAMPGEAVTLLRERAQLLLAAGESLAAAEAYDDLLRRAPDDLVALEQRAELAAKAGGALASQPYDRRLLQLGGEGLSHQVQLRLQLRLGHAALHASALQDAAEALEAVVTLDPEGERGQEALSLLAEVHARRQDPRGLYGVTLKLAARAGAAEAEALYRRAASLVDDPAEAAAALLPLAALRPGDGQVVERALLALRALGRDREQVELLQKSAEALGGPAGAERLLAAAAVAAERLADPERARALTRLAGQLAPHHPPVLRASIADHRAQGERAALRDALAALLRGGPEAEESALLRLELGQLLVVDGQLAAARAALEEVVHQGPSSPGYAEALEALEPLLHDEGDAVRRAEVLAARAGLHSGATQAKGLLAAAEVMAGAGMPARAVELCRAAVAAHPTEVAVLLLAELHGALGEPARRAAALLQAAGFVEPARAAPLLLQAAEAWELAGEPSEARELLERVLLEHPEALRPAEAARRFDRLGAPARAAGLGFGPAMEAGDYAAALTFAEKAADAAGVERALWALARADASTAPRLGELLEAGGDDEGLLKLARLMIEGGELPYAGGLLERVFLLTGDDGRRAEALRLLVEQGRFAQAAAHTLEGALPHRSGQLELLLGPARATGGELQAQVLAAAAEALPLRRAALRRELYEQRLARGELSAAATTLRSLADEEDDPRGRATLYLELGELLQDRLNEEGAAKEAFERALAFDAESTRAVQRLLRLYLHLGPREAFVAMAERLEQRAGLPALRPHLVELVGAYEALGRLADAYRLLAQLPEAPETLARRAGLAVRLGRSGEALQLKERYLTAPAELEEVLLGYLDAQLVPFAVRLAQRLLDARTLTARTTRVVAERLTATAQGAPLAVRLWPQLLRASLADADGWTLFAEALRRAGAAERAARADGIGAALAASATPAPWVRPSPLSRAEESGFGSRPRDLRALAASSMPRLHRALAEALTGLGASEVSLWLDPRGGCEAYLVSPRELVLGAGALAQFGAGELTYLVALGLALGASGASLARPGEVAGFEEAALRAFAAVPSSLAAARVLAALDPRVRGLGPRFYSMSEVLPSNGAFQKVALRLLDVDGTSEGT